MEVSSVSLILNLLGNWMFVYGTPEAAHPSGSADSGGVTRLAAACLCGSSFGERQMRRAGHAPSRFVLAITSSHRAAMR